jgi:hypothetical protein
VDEHGDILTRARRAYAAQDWRSAAARFDAVPPQRLTADDLAAYADAVWWLGRIEDNLRLGAAACDAFLAESRPAEAARIAMVLGIFHMARGDEPQAVGWLGRAGRLAEGIPESPVHGYVLSFTAVEASLMAGQPAAAVDAARRVQDLGRRVDAPDLVAVGMNGEGRALIRSGHLVDGLALLDEAMVTVLDGQLAPFISGTLYCHTIAACHEVADVRRMTRWTDLAERWLTTFPAAVFFGGLCGVHRAQLLLLRGEWDEAEQVALRVVVDLDANRIDYAAEAWYVVAEARRLRGDPGAGDAYDEAHARGRDPQPGRALLQLQTGDAAGPRRRCARPWRRWAPTLCPAPRCVRRWWRSRSPRDGWTTRWPPLPSSRRRRRRTRPRGWRRWLLRHVARCCWPRVRQRQLFRCCARPVGAGTNWAQRTTPPAPVSGSPRPTGRSVTRSPPPRRSSVQRPFISGWACTGRRGNRPTG